MKKAYVIGKNASKSLSPTIFNYWFKKYNIKESIVLKRLMKTILITTSSHHIKREKPLWA